MNKDQFAYLNETIVALESERDKLKAQNEAMRKACQATHDYFSYLCKVYHGERTLSGTPKVSSTQEIRRLCDIAGKALSNEAGGGA